MFISRRSILGLLLVCIAIVNGKLANRGKSPIVQSSTTISAPKVEASIATPADSTRLASSSPVTVAAGSVSSPASSMQATLSLIGLFIAWYAFNAGYNVFNAFMKRDFHFPYSTSALQMALGLIYAIPLWLTGIREKPVLTFADLKTLLPIVFLNALGHTVTVVATFEKGGGSFTHVIKSAEPVVSVLLAFLVNRIVPKPMTFLSLLPVTYGVAYASTLGKLNPATMSKELTTKAAKLAMTSNFAFAMRSIMRKNLPSDFKKRTKLNPANEFAVTTILSLFMIVPLAFLFEGGPGIANAYKSLANQNAFLRNTFMAGMSYYIYNEMQNNVLGSLGPVPTAVGNTLKRVVIFVALYLFTAGETFPLPKVVGCAIAIAGCLAYAICDSKKI